MTITTTRRAPARPNGSVGNWVAVNERDYPWNTIGTVLSGGGMDHNDFLDGKTIGHLTDHLMTAAEALAATGLDQIVIQKVPVKDATTGKVIPRAFHTDRKSVV